MTHNISRRGRPSRHLVYQRLEEAMTELRQRRGGLPSPADAERVWTAIWYQDAHHSTALEGNTLVLKQVEALLAEGRAVGNKELSEYLEVTGYAAAAQWVYGQALNSGSWAAQTPLTLTEVGHVHELALGPVWGVAPHPNARPSERPGSFREHDLEPFPGGMAPPSWVRVQAAMTDWARSLAAVVARDNPVESLAAAHGAFERIHPFLDGNGRTGRLLLNLLLVRSGYPPAVIYTRDRTRYLQALSRADAGDPGPLGELVARAVTDNLYRFVVPAVAGPNLLVPLASLASREHSLVSLRVAIERGRLKGQRSPDGQWRSTRTWLAEYLASRYRRQP
ncbi:MAG TPA: Fic family protein [Candidatus Nanopelagicaceae bacterium]|nr:Fic family protein [Candidatus Nanopelagicaceae bacterium]